MFELGRRLDECGGGAEASQPWTWSSALYISSRSYGLKDIGIPTEADIDRADEQHSLSNIDAVHLSAYARLNRGLASDIQPHP